MNQLNANQLILELASLLQVDAIDESALHLCIKLINEGIDPEKLARHILTIRKETSSIVENDMI